MVWQSWLYLSLAGLAVLFSLLLMYLAFNRRSLPVARTFFWINLLIFIWALAYLVELLSGDAGAKIFWEKVQFLGFVYIAPTWLILVFGLTRQGSWLTRRWLVLYEALPTLTLLLAWTNDWHHLIWRAVWLVPVGPLTFVDLSFSLGFWVFAGYAYVLIFLGVLLLVRAFLHAHSPYNRQILVLLAGALIPWCANMVDISGQSPFPYLDITVIAFSFSGLFFVWGILRFRLLDFLPVIREAVIENMRDGVLVLDEAGRIVDLNPAAQQILGCAFETALGQSAVDVLVEFPGLPERLLSGQAEHEEVAWGEGEHRRCFDLRLSPLYDRYGYKYGHLLVWIDITGRVQAEQVLHRRDDILEAVSFTAAQLLASFDWDQGLQELLMYLGQATGVSRVCLLENGLVAEAADAMRLYGEWAAAGLEPQTGGLSSDDLSSLAVDHPTWGERLRCREVVYEHVQDIPAGERGWFEERRIRSMVIVPLFVSGEWWGGIGFIDCQVERRWSQPEIGALQAAADILGAAIHRKQMSEALRRQLEELRVLHSVAIAGAEATSEDALIERVTQIIGEALYPDNFGLLLVGGTGKYLRPHPSYRHHGEQDQFKPIALGQGITGSVAQDGQPRRIADVNLEPNYLQVDVQARSELCVPIKVGNQMIGVINAESVYPEAFTEADERLLSTVAGQLATAIDRLRAAEAERRQAGQLATLYRVSQEIVASLELEERYVATHNAAARLMQVDTFIIALLNESRQEIEPVYFYDRDQLVDASVIPAQRALSERVISTGELLLITSREQIEDFWTSDPELACSILAVPMRLGGKVFGMLSCQSYQLNAYNPDDLQTFGTLANYAAIAISNARLFTETRRRAQQLALLNELAREMTGMVGIDHLCEAVVQRLCSPFGYYNVSIFTADQAAQEVVLQAIAHPLAGIQPGEYRQPFSRGVIGRAAKTGQVTLVNDTRGDADFIQIEGVTILSELAIPLIMGERAIGVLNVNSNQLNAFDESDVATLTTVADQFAVTFEKTRLFDETRRRAGQLEALNAIVAAASVAPNLRYLLEIALDQTLHALELSLGRIWVGEQYIQRGLPEGHGQDLRPAFNLSELDVSVPQVVEDWSQVTEGQVHYGLAAHMARLGIRTTLAAPILFEGQPIGGLTVASRELRAWLAEEITLVEGVGHQLGGTVERIRLLERIQDHARQVQQIMDTVPEGVALLDQDRRVILANPAGSEYLLGLGRMQMGEPLVRLGEFQLIDALRPSNGEVSWQELEIKGPPHQIFECAIKPLAEDHAGGWVLVLRDVTREREDQARIQMQERLATVGQLAAGIAHDFNNILATIIVYADLMKRDTNLSPTSRERLNIIHQQVQRAASLIRQILDFSRRSVMEQSVLDLLPFVKELDRLLVRVLPETIRLKLSYQPGSYLVNADPTRLQQVFMNLAVNARDAMPVGGTLHFELDRVHLSPGQKLSNPEIPAGDWIRVTVSDTGTGLSPEVMAHIFEPFFTTKPVGQGTGLGLAQVYGIIKQHDGYIDVHSREGEGTAFQIYLRALVLPAAQEDTSPESDVLGGAAEWVLIVEDDEAARGALQAFLQANNYQVLTATDGLEALRIFEQFDHSIDVVVSDMVMPHMGGVALYRELVESQPGVKMLFVTGHPLQDQDRDLLRKGSVHWLQKPFSLAELSLAIRNLIEPHS